LKKNKSDKKPFSLEEQIEWIAIAFVLALTVRCFIVEAYQIPTGSMAPTLYGKHYEITCENCGSVFNLRLDEGVPLSLGFACPVCREKLSRSNTRVKTRGGDRILVAKDLYVFTEPKRWDIFVFKNPEEGHENMNFVKRLVGLPGETVEIRNGQVFIDGRIARKPPRIQQALLQNVYNGLHENAAHEYWLPHGSWRIRDGGLLLADGAAGTQTVEFAPPILDDYSYNGGMGQNVVPDLVVSGHLLLETDHGEFSAAVWADSDTWRATFQPAGGAVEVKLRLNERTVREGRLLDATPLDFDFSLSSVDGMVTVAVNGLNVIQFDAAVSVAETPLYTRACGVFFQGRESPMFLSRIEIKRDIYYRSDLARSDLSVGRPFVIEVPEGHYLGLGDNSPISRDSRQWGVIPERNVLGKAFFVFWPVTRIGSVF